MFSSSSMSKNMSFLFLLFMINHVFVEGGKYDRAENTIDLKRANISVVEGNKYAKLITRAGIQSFAWKMDLQPSGKDSMQYVWKDNWSYGSFGEYDPQPICSAKNARNDNDKLIGRLLQPQEVTQDGCTIKKGDRSFSTSARAKYSTANQLDCKGAKLIIKIIPNGESEPIATVAYDAKISGPKCK